MSGRHRVRRALIAGAVLVAAPVGAVILTKASDTDPRATGQAVSPSVRVLSSTSFEARLGGWRGTAASVRRVAVRAAPQGKRVLRVTRRSGGPVYGVDDVPDTVQMTRRGSVYRVTARARAAGLPSVRRPAFVVITERTRGGVLVRVVRGPAVRLRTRFARLTAAIRPRQGHRLSVEVRHRSPLRGSAFDVDLIRTSEIRGGTAPGGAPVDAAGAGHSAPAANETRPVGAPPGSAPPLDTAPRPDAVVLPYDPQALFNRPLGGSPPIHPRSGGIAAEVAANVRIEKVNALITGEVPPVFVAAPTDPLYTVTANGVTERFRVPRSTVPGDGADHPLIVLDRSNPRYGRDVELRVWQASVDHGARRISGSGLGLFHFNNDGGILNRDGTRSIGNPFLGQGAGSGLSYLAGLLRPEDISSGRIRHAIRISYACNDFTDDFVPPATKTDQPCSSSTPAGRRVDMGMRLQLDPSVDCNSRTAPVPPGRTSSARETEFLRILCRGMQEYGLIVLDGTKRDGLFVYMESEATADWGAVAGQALYGGYGWILRDQTTPDDGLRRDGNSGIPWSRLRAIG